MNPSTAPILIDTGPMVALIDGNDQHHQVCDAVAQEITGAIFTCLPVVTEAVYMVNRVEPNLAKQIRHAFATGIYQLLPLTELDIDHVFCLMDKYNDQQFDFTDACLMYLAQREGIEKVFTIDRKDFSVFRLQAGKPLTLLPKPG